MALTDNLVAYWRLEESSGPRVDSSGNGRDMSPSGSPGGRTGKLNNAADFVPGSSQRLEIAAASLGSVFVGTASWTMAGWVLADDTATFREVAGQLSGSLRGPLLRYNGAGILRAQWFNDAAGSFEAPTTVSISSGTWYFLAAWYSASDGKLYIRVNATTSSGVTLTGTFSASTAPFALGNRAGTGGSIATYWDGGIDDFGIWSRALTSGELDQLYNSGAGLDPTASTGSALPLFAAQMMAMR